MRRSETLKKFKKLHAEMRANLVAAGVEAEKFDRLDADKAGADPVVADRHAVLAALREGPEYRAFARIYTERKPEWWANMELLDQTDGVEFRVLRKTATALRRAFKAAARTLKPEAVAARLDRAAAAAGAERFNAGRKEAVLEPEEADAEARA